PKNRKKTDGFPKDRIYTNLLSSPDGDIRVLLQEAETFCEKWSASPKQTYFVTMAIEEICLAITGFAAGHGRCLLDLVLVAEEDGGFTLHIRDNARRFNPFELTTSKVGGDDFHEDAMGIMVLKQKAKEFFYRQYGGFNSLVIKI
ncbi:MAG: ATP-binding protein, partial [Clostridia bacterium]|nr:ATP-binding protein [Clostridia bacterium]